MKKSNQPSVEQMESAYESLKEKLSQIGWISEGYVQDRGRGSGGPNFQWTRKVKGKTVSVALSEEQYHWMLKAIENWREMQATIKEMQQLSREVLFTTVQEPTRRKQPSKDVLGLK